MSWRVLFYAYAVLTLVTVAAMRGTPEAPLAAPGAKIRYGLAAIGLSLATLHSTLQTRGTELVPAARGKFGRLVDNGRITLAMAICAIGLATVGYVVAREKPVERARGNVAA